MNAACEHARAGRRRWAVVAPFVLLAAGCGPAAIGAAISNNGNNGNSNAPPTLSGLRVEGFTTSEPKIPPARLRFVLADPEADPVAVELLYTVPAAPAQQLALSGVRSLPASFATSRDGIEHSLTWDFDTEPGIPSDGSLLEGVQVIARLRAGGAGQQITVRLGNDEPVISQVASPAGEISGVVPVGFRLQDSSDDVVDVEVEYHVEGDPPGRWQRARPAGPNVVPGEPAFRGVVAPRGGRDLVFFWDTDSPLGDLRDLERDVRLRFTPIDPVVTGVPVESDAFHVDNNAEPTIQLGEGAFIANPDDRRGIPIPFTVFDEERDPVRVVFQWRRQSQPDFPPLGTSDPAELAQLLLDPAYVRERQVCTPFPAHARGHASPVDATHVRLRELQQGESRVLAGGLEFRHLELLRPAPLARLAAGWTYEVLVRPVAALPLGNGITALVLDDAGGSARLLELDLATGGVQRTVAAGLPGSPTAMAFERDDQRVLVATDVGGSWRLHRVEIATGAATTLIAAGAGGAMRPVGPLRAVFGLGDGAALATAEDSLWRLDWRSSPGKVVALRDNLATPWGLAHDPLRPDHVLVAERDADRIIAFDLRTRALPVPATGAGGPALPRPTAIAIGASGTGPRLVALCDAANPAERELLGLSLGPSDHAVFSLGRVPADAASVAIGPANLLLVALPFAADLMAGGGIEQQRELLAVDLATGTVAVASAFAPAVRELQAWRIDVGRSFSVPVRGAPDGTSGVFVWDSRDAGFRDRVLLQATPMDAETGRSVLTSTHRATENVDVLTPINAGVEPSSVVAADLDGDGALDLACATELSSDLRLFFQNPVPRTFTTVTLPLPFGASPSSVAAADLDDDGAVDLVCANAGSDDLTVFRQDPVLPRAFAPTVTVALPLGASSPRSVAAADLDGDAAVDLVCANAGSSNLTVLFQAAPLTFTTRTLPLAAGSGPVSVVVADLDGDGYVDVVCADKDSDDLAVFYLGASRTFTPAPPLLAGDGPVSVAAADLDGDGALDLVCANEDSNDLSVFYQGAPRTFTAAAPLAVGARPTSVAAADLDGDGSPDLACANGTADTVTVFHQRTPRTFTAAPPLTTGSDAAAVAAANLDGDGGLDLVCANRRDGNLTLFFHEQPREFKKVDLPAVGIAPIALAAADLDGDGVLDLAGANTQSNDLTVYLQDPPRTFAVVASLPAGTRPVSVAAADLDGDGALDLVAASTNTDELRLFFQDAPQTFTAAQPLVTGQTPRSAVAADLDGDGDLDLVCANMDSGSLSLFYQDAPRQFAAAQSVAIGGSPKAVAAADLDGDGALDLVCANSAGSTLTVLYQEGARPFVATQQQLPTGSAPGVVAVADLDGDGDLDLVSGNGLGRSLTVLYQQGARTFVAASPPLPTVEPPTGLAAADLDGDGVLDLVCVSHFFASSVLRVFYQDAPGRFVAAPPRATGNAPAAVFAADLDGDGDLDVACANSGGNHDHSLFFGRSR